MIEYHVGWDGERDRYSVEVVFAPGSWKLVGHRKTVAGVQRLIRQREARLVEASGTTRVARVRWFGFRPRSGDEALVQ